MAGFSNETMYANNVNFNGPGNKSPTVVADGQLLIGATASPNIRIGTLSSFDGSLTISNGAGTISLSVAGGTTVGKTISGNSGGNLPPLGGNWAIIGDGSITSAGSGSTLTFQLQNLTNHNVLIGAGTTTITKVAPSATAGIPLVSNGSSADPSFSTALVVGGGTGITSATAYAVICGGTTTTAAFQPLAALGAAGTVLTSNGASTLPSFQAVGGSGAFSSIVVQSFTASGANTYTPTTNMKYAIVSIWGGGGGAGGCQGNAAGNASAGGGGGGGAYVQKVFTAATIGASQTVTIGAGGAGGVGANNGSNGTATTFGGLLTANAGNAGAVGVTTAGTGNTNGGGGGSATGGDFNVSGGTGGFGGTATAGVFELSGYGGASYVGQGAVAVSSNAGGQGAVANSGGGGSGGSGTPGGGGTGGGAGGSGGCTIIEFI